MHKHPRGSPLVQTVPLQTPGAQTEGDQGGGAGQVQAGFVRDDGGFAREAAIVAHESGLDLARAATLVAFGLRTRRLQGHGLDEGASTRMLVHAAALAVQGLSMGAACRMAVVDALSDDPSLLDALHAALEASL